MKPNKPITPKKPAANKKPNKQKEVTAQSFVRMAEHARTLARSYHSTPGSGMVGDALMSLANIFALEADRLRAMR